MVGGVGTVIARAITQDRMRQEESAMQQHDETRAQGAQQTGKVKDMLRDAIAQARDEVGRVRDPKAQALLETSAEVLQGLVTAYEHYEHHAERAWQ